MPTIRQEVDALVRQYHTRNPEELCDYLSITVIETPLSENIQGFFLSVLENGFIYVNDGLPEGERQLTLAHELGHAVLHPQLNSLFLSRFTLMASSRYEREADSFACHLLLEDRVFDVSQYGYDTLEKISWDTGVPLRCVELKWEELCQNHLPFMNS